MLTGNVLVGDVRDGAGLAGLGLDAHTLLRVLDSGRLEDHARHGVVVAATDGADGQTVATGANTVREPVELLSVHDSLRHEDRQGTYSMLVPELMATQSSWL